MESAIVATERVRLRPPLGGRIKVKPPSAQKYAAMKVAEQEHEAADWFFAVPANENENMVEFEACVEWYPDAKHQRATAGLELTQLDQLGHGQLASRGNGARTWVFYACHGGAALWAVPCFKGAGKGAGWTVELDKVQLSRTANASALEAAVVQQLEDVQRDKNAANAKSSRARKGDAGRQVGMPYPPWTMPP